MLLWKQQKLQWHSIGILLQRNLILGNSWAQGSGHPEHGGIYGAAQRGEID